MPVVLLARIVEMVIQFFMSAASVAIMVARLTASGR